MPHAYEWSVLRVVPRVERGEFVNAGVLVYCQALDYLGCAVALDESAALALDRTLDLAAVPTGTSPRSVGCATGIRSRVRTGPARRVIGSAGWSRREARWCRPPPCTPA